MELYYQPEISNGVSELGPDESRHCIKVLRHCKGDVIAVTDGKGILYSCEIESENAKRCSFKVISEVVAEPKDYTVAIAIAPTKSIDRTEWFVEKAVELGIDVISFYYGHHSERRNLNLERLQKKAVAAMKQSGQSKVPEMQVYKTFSACITEFESFDEQFIAYVDKSNPDELFKIASSGRKQVVFIGPEGDFSVEELKQALENGFKKVSLGKNRLRTETAAVAACHILNLVNS